MTAGTLNAVNAHQGVPAADRAAPTPRARRSTRCARSTRRRWRRPRRATPSAPPAPSAARCTASPCSSRTTSTRRASRPRRARSRWRTRSRTRDSTVVAKLRAAGAILLGKANLSEFANFIANGVMPSGYSSLGGQVLNPYDADITPSGSSSGSGAVAAAGLARDHDRHRDVGLDHQPGERPGRRRPAADGRAREPRTGILPISATQDTAGPDDPDRRRRRSGVGRDRRQGSRGPGHRRPQPDTVPDYLAGLSTTALHGQADRRHQQQQRAVRGGGRGGPVARRDDGPDLDADALPARPRSCSRSSSAIITAYFSRLPASAPMKTLADIDRLQQRARERRAQVRPGNVPAERGDDLNDPAEHAAYVVTRDNGRRGAQQAIDNALTRGTADLADDLEAIMTPGTTLIGDRRAGRLPAARRPGRLQRRRTASRSGSRSPARPTARRSCSRSATPTSRRRRSASRRARSTRACGAASPATRTRSRRAPARRTSPRTRT